MHGKDWAKAVAILSVSLIVAVGGLVIGITDRDVVTIVIGGICTVFFSFATALMLLPAQLACMQMVKGEMTYKQMKDAVEAENFEQPIRFLQRDHHPGLFLASNNWVVVEDHGNPVYIPKRKVRKIEMLMEPVKFGSELSGDGNTYTHFCNYFILTCDEDRVYATGLISHDSAPDAKRAIEKHFPYVPIEEVHTPQEWKR